MKNWDGTIYNVSYRTLSIKNSFFNAMLCALPPAQSSDIHNHHEQEVFVFTAGSGICEINHQTTPVQAGSVVTISPYEHHVIKNTHPNLPLTFLSLYWSDPLPNLPKPNADLPQKTLIFSTPFTPNGDLHLGHLAGPYLAADIYKRYLTLQQKEALHVTGQDDHQTYVMKKSIEQSQPPKQLANHYANEVKQTLHTFNVTLDYFIKPNETNDYATFIQTCFIDLYNQGFIYEKEAPAFFDQQGRYLHEAYISGLCPHCLQTSDGNACEACGRPNDCVDLMQAKDQANHQAPIIGTAKRLYFRLSAFQSALTTYIKSSVLSHHAFALSQTLLNDLPDICISHPSTWGIPIPLDAYHNQTLYVWFEMAFSYLWAAMQLAPAHLPQHERLQHFYGDHAQTRIIHFYGFDNTYYHTLLFPAVYFALGLTPPRIHITNELLNLDHQKFSTSRGHVINGRALAKQVPVDYIRWYAAHIRPENQKENFELSAFINECNRVFAADLSTWINTLSTLIHTHCQGHMPEPGAWTAKQRAYLNQLLQYRQLILDAYHIDAFSPQTITLHLNHIMKQAHQLLKTISFIEPIPALKNYLRTDLALSLLSLKTFAQLSHPIIPTIAGELMQFLNVDTSHATLEDITFPSGKLGTLLQLHEATIQ